MKKTILLLITCIAQLLHAQPILTMCNRSFTNGDCINYNTIQYDTVGAFAGGGGATAIWDYSDLTIQNSVGSYECYYYPQNTPYGFYFPNSTIGSNFDLNYSFKYYSYLPNAVSYHGVHYSQQDCHKYSDPLQEIVCPMKFLSGFYDIYAGRDCQNTHFSGAKSVYYDGYGTLILPGTTVYNVVRLHSLDTLSIGGNVHFREIYTWYEPGFFLALLTMVRERVAGVPNAIFTVTRYQFYNSTSIANAEVFESSVVLSPNPVHQQLNIDAPLKLKARYLVISDLAGREIRRFLLEGGHTTVLLEDLVGGLYLYRVLDLNGGLIESGKFVREVGY